MQKESTAAVVVRAFKQVLEEFVVARIFLLAGLKVDNMSEANRKALPAGTPAFGGIRI
jgi:hypothetical protein